MTSVRDPPDLRLLPSAVAAWALTAATLGAAPVARLAGAAGLAVVVAAVAAVVAVRRRSLSSGSVSSGSVSSGSVSSGSVSSGRSHRVAALCSALALAALASAACLAASALHAQVRGAGTVAALAARGASVRLVGTVASDPRPLADHSPVPHDQVLLRLAVASVDGRGLRSRVSSRVLVFADPRWSRARWGERVEARGRLAPARPGDDVQATLTARGPPRVLGAAPAFARVAERLRRGLRRACAPLAPDPRGLLPGLVVGDTSLQPADLGADLKATGLTHLSAVSGTNVTIVCVVALALGRGVGLGRRGRLLGAGAVLAGFVVLARPEPSVLRAAVMGVIGLIALAGARRRAGVPVLSCAVVVLLLLDPWLARSYGFALSVLASLGLLLFARPWSEALTRHLPWLPRPVAVAVAVPLAAQAACGPVVVLLSGQVSLVSLPANVVAAPLVAPATVLGLAAALASLASAQLAAWLAQLAGWPCAVITAAARHLAAVPGGQVAWPGGARGALSLAVLTLAAVLLAAPAGRWAARHRLSATALGVVTLTAWLPLPGTASWPPPGWVGVVCDVGQGDAIVLATGPGHAVLVDAGPEPAAVDACLRRLSVRVLDVVVLTHFHADHVEGLPGALRGRRAGYVLVTIVDDPPAEARRVRGWAAAAGVPVRTVTVGDDTRVGPVRWRVLWPARVVRDGSVPNNSSIVLRVDSAGLRLLLLGDVEPAAARLVAQRLERLPEGPAVDVLKVAHHGSALQDPGLVTAAAARLALVSVGAGNDYGHPAPSTLRLLAGTGATVARTDLQGDLAVVRTPRGPGLVWSGPRRTPGRAGRSPVGAGR